MDSAEIAFLGHRYTEIARGYAYEHYDLPLIIRAVRYINQAFGLPQMSDTYWFATVLPIVLEIDRPNTGLDEASKAFLKDMLEGIEQSLAD